MEGKYNTLNIEEFYQKNFDVTDIFDKLRSFEYGYA
jgi:hypothetical protein